MFLALWFRNAQTNCQIKVQSILLFDTLIMFCTLSDIESNPDTYPNKTYLDCVFLCET